MVSFPAGDNSPRLFFLFIYFGVKHPGHKNDHLAPHRAGSVPPVPHIYSLCA